MNNLARYCWATVIGRGRESEDGEWVYGRGDRQMTVVQQILFPLLTKENTKPIQQYRSGFRQLTFSCTPQSLLAFS